MVNASLISVKGDANSLAAAQFGLEKAIKVDTAKAAVIAIGDDELSQKATKDLEKVPFKVVIASHVSALTASADVVFPAAIWLEQAGHFLSLDGRLQDAARALVPAEEVKPVDEALVALAAKLDIKLDDDWKKDLHKRTSIVAIEE
ncbi:hypothetical protein SDC9_171574 [bioreactor metagenome]|uniref:Molybdopterin oxidoreductase domain-containing protein n=1 Tax=bioreactor metagenome TaxID=1076179 RepID=A0A645GDM8_9ZZZZ